MPGVTLVPLLKIAGALKFLISVNKTQYLVKKLLVLVCLG